MNSQNKSLEQYTHNYEEIGSKLLEHPINDYMYQIIADFLPNNYKAVDLGCNNNKDAKLIQQMCAKQGKNGVFLGVDPYYSMEGIISMTSQQFMRTSKQQQFDLIMGKYSLHLNQDMNQFFKNAYRCLKDKGRMFILALSKYTKLPWTKSLQETFINPYVDYEETIPKELFQWDSVKQKYEFEINKKIFIEIIRRRSWSTMLRNSDQEINECIAALQSEDSQNLPVVIKPQLYIISKKLPK